MAVVIGVPACAAPGEQRSPIVPDVVKKLKAAGAEIVVQRGATAGAFLDEATLPDVSWVDTTAEVTGASDVLWVVAPPDDETLAALKPGTVLIGMLSPYASAERLALLNQRQITSFAMELLPRISRAQSMDVLSSQGSASGYQTVLIAATRAPKFFPMLTYAAGTIRPSRVLVIGAGVAGLQAIATAKRLGAVVEAYDVRPETREQIESLGAKFVDTGVSAAGSGGYARELTDEEKAQQRDKLAKAVANCDVLITTAGVPGKKAPVIVDAAMVAGMKPGAVVVDMLAENGGNVEGTVAGKDVQVGPAHIVGPVNLPSRMPVHASEMFSKNLLNFTNLLLSDGVLKLDWDDEVLAGTCLTHDGEVKHPMVKQVLGIEG
ncbi:MAG: NAD(P) transhydrogenase subunit alpha [Propionibacteriaceae bacterium]|jgi:NAD(P) transhydrogenase subunit alpha|nr:NAD(P) transhydrogenase subunit alpha [Propionibacteriaceae bacterium]